MGRGFLPLVLALGCRTANGLSTLSTDPRVTPPLPGEIVARVLPTQLVRVALTTETPERVGITATWPGAAPLRLSDPEPTLLHIFEFIGSPPEVDLVIEIEGDGVSEVVELDTPPVPEWIPLGREVVPTTTPSEVGWTLTNISNVQRDWPASAVIYDAKGVPIWHYTPEPHRADLRGDLDVRLTADGTILIGPTAREQAPVEVRLDGSKLWDGPVFDPLLHHHFDKLADGTFLALQVSPPTDTVLILGPDHDVRWSWVAHEHLLQTPPPVRDFLHLNSVTLTDDALYVSSRHLSTIFKIDRATGDILWRLGKDRDFELLQGEWFLAQHDPQLLANGNWLVYDNTREGPSRIVEVAIDEDERTAEIVWTFPGEGRVDPWYTEAWFSPIWGDADRLPSGGVRVTFGNRIGKRSRIFDVHPNGEVVWAIDFEVGVGLYRSVPLSWVDGTIADPPAPGTTR